jgi:hypothetical protein
VQRTACAQKLEPPIEGVANMRKTTTTGRQIIGRRTDVQSVLQYSSSDAQLPRLKLVT